jgi:diguanylate cyclase (GGDEF)-like protein
MKCTFLDSRQVALDEGLIGVWFCRRREPFLLSPSKEIAQAACAECPIAERGVLSQIGQSGAAGGADRQLAALSTVMSLVDSPFELATTLERGLAEIVGTLGGDGGWIAFESGLLRDAPCVVGVSGETADSIVAQGVTAGVAGLVFREQEAVVVDDSAATPAALRASLPDGVSVLLTVPIRERSRVLGVLTVISCRPCSFTADDVAFASVATAQLGVAAGRALAAREQSDRVDRQRLLLDAAETVNRSLESLSLETTILAEAARLMNAHKAALLVARGDVLVAQEVYGLSDRHKQLFVVSLAGSAWGRAVLSGQTVAVNDVAADDVLAAEGEYHSFLAAPLNSSKGTSYALTVFYDKPRRFTESEQTLLRTFAVQAAVALDNRRLMREKDQMAARDGLTGVYNRSYLELAMERTTKEMRRNGGTASILFIDLDGMKTVNDTQGHQAGDRLLCELAALLSASCRETDIVARYGGDEFVVLMPGTDDNGARRVALEVEQAIARRNTEAPGATRLSASMGMHTADASGIDDLLREADRRMYATKRRRRGGRSR